MNTLVIQQQILITIFSIFQLFILNSVIKNFFENKNKISRYIRVILASQYLLYISISVVTLYSSLVLESNYIFEVSLPMMIVISLPMLKFIHATEDPQPSVRWVWKIKYSESSFSATRSFIIFDKIQKNLLWVLLIVLIVIYHSLLRNDLGLLMFILSLTFSISYLLLILHIEYFVSKILSLNAKYNYLKRLILENNASSHEMNRYKEKIYELYKGLFAESVFYKSTSAVATNNEILRLIQKPNTEINP